MKYKKKTKTNFTCFFMSQLIERLTGKHVIYFIPMFNCKFNRFQQAFIQLLSIQITKKISYLVVNINYFVFNCKKCSPVWILSVIREHSIILLKHKLILQRIFSAIKLYDKFLGNYSNYQIATIYNGIKLKNY